jgi:hypothetical protein
MRKSLVVGLSILQLSLGCSGSSPDDPNAIIVDDTGSSTDDTGLESDDTGDDTAVEPSFDTGISADSTSGDAADSTVTDSATTDDAISDAGSEGTPTTKVKTVFVLVLENHSWSSIKGSKSAPYINSLLALGAHAEKYTTPPKNHPSEPNYIWLEAGDNLGITNDSDPSSNHQATKDHLVTQLETAGVSWKAYQEDIDGKSCPLTSSGLYGAKHCPMVFFDDVTDTNKSSSTHCIEHIRPFSELVADLTSGSVARYNFITPNLCHDMHGDAPFGTKCNDKVPFSGVDLIKLSDDWLKVVVPKILASAAYKDVGALFITWDEGDESALGLGTACDGPIGMIVLSPLANVGHSNSIAYTHSSTVKTMERIFGVPYLRGAAASGTTDLEDLFVPGALP